MTKVSHLQWRPADIDAKRQLICDLARCPGQFSSIIREVQRPYGPGHDGRRRGQLA